jgi:hypothetical protein
MGYINVGYGDDGRIKWMKKLLNFLDQDEIQSQILIIFF